MWGAELRLAMQSTSSWICEFIKLWGSEDMFGRSALTCRPRAICRTNRPTVEPHAMNHFTRIRENTTPTPGQK
jgi:hypothetical protein